MSDLAMSPRGPTTPKVQQGEYQTIDDDSAPTSKFAVRNPFLRECLAEFFGTFIFIAFAMGVNNQVSVSQGAAGSYLSVNIGWGIGIMFGVHVAGGITGAHLNPAVSIAQAVYKGLPWWKVPGYAAAQTLGAFLAALAIFCMYKPSLDFVDPDHTFTKGNFGTYPAAHVSHLCAFYTELFGTAMLVLGIFAIFDKKNCPASPFSASIHIFFLFTGLGICFGMNTGYALNPARDFGPRFFTAIAGWGFKVFSAENYYFWIPLIAPLFGGVIGGGLYTLLIENHHPEGKEPEPEVPV